MYIHSFNTSYPGEASYMVESNGEVAIIDPFNGFDSYQDLAADRQLNIKYIFETHLHTDFGNGQIALGKATGAPIIFGPKTATAYPVSVAKDEEVFSLGAITITAIHTPGHTIESTCWLLKNEQGENHAIFTGNNFSTDDVKGPEPSVGNIDSVELAGMLFDSIQNKILPLEDRVIVYPGHLSGIETDKNEETKSTVGELKQAHFAFGISSKEAFIQKLNERLDEAPRHFSVDPGIHKTGYQSLKGFIQKGTTPLALDVFKERINDEDVIILDTRSSKIFSNGFIPGSISIGLDGRFAEWAGSLLPFNAPMLLVCEPGTEAESVTMLARVGFDKMEGYLSGGFEAWRQAHGSIDLVIDIETDELAIDLPHDDKLVVVDVRNESEFASGHIKNAINLPLKDMNDPGNIAILPEDGNIYLHCSSGYRSTIAASLLKRQGLHNIRKIEGGWPSINEQKDIKVVRESSVLN